MCQSERAYISRMWVYVRARVYVRVYRLYHPGEKGGNSSLNAHLGKGVAFATVVDSAATTPESTPLCSGVKKGEKEKEREKRKEEEKGGERVKEKPEDSQLSTLSDDDIIVRATYISPLYQELFPAAFAQNENKRWWNLLNCRLRKRGTLDRGMFFCLLSTSYVTITNFTWDTSRLILIIAFELFNVHLYVFKSLIFLFHFLIFLWTIRKGIRKQLD